ncbi:hypothetical protein RIR_jg37082.t1 [Rhizophagus irregularis DAOM 181602=DAOM 197198]|uniref:Reverse transcriptase domain-containing protein n=1 Tax=Rhizophagus irregularis (strain DAOM 197198w) TaxID=1432141 RepID=A0A015I064_RHIIW|nr:hypothetical protein RirG_272090 [Rhizophagus irregularis DAOM 197198w]GET56399.1 hypothetical protein RIR_jg37082.t1 [Rhizophagus irregularis DAOM 181602=DAOM 197198]
MQDPYCLTSPLAPASLSSSPSLTNSLQINNLVFMDDSTLISSSKAGMKHMLSITEEFYCFNNTFANNNKYVLATNAISSVQDLSPVTFTLQTSSSFHFLGV